MTFRLPGSERLPETNYRHYGPPTASSLARTLAVACALFAVTGVAAIGGLRSQPVDPALLQPRTSPSPLLGNDVASSTNRPGGFIAPRSESDLKANTEGVLACANYS